MCSPFPFAVSSFGSSIQMKIEKSIPSCIRIRHCIYYGIHNSQARVFPIGTVGVPKPTFPFSYMSVLSWQYVGRKVSEPVGLQTRIRIRLSHGLRPGRTKAKFHLPHACFGGRSSPIYPYMRVDVHTWVTVSLLASTVKETVEYNC